jgi:PadR family transcriptional regulator, regulatory protein PadR
VEGYLIESGDTYASHWEAQTRKGCLELAILASVWKKRLYGMEILHALQGSSSLGLAEGTLYLILNRLRKGGLVDSEWVDAGTGHPRKYYWLTESGKQRLLHMAQFWVQFSANLNSLLEPVLGREECANVRQ